MEVVTEPNKFISKNSTRLKNELLEVQEEFLILSHQRRRVLSIFRRRRRIKVDSFLLCWFLSGTESEYKKTAKFEVAFEPLAKI